MMLVVGRGHYCNDPYCDSLNYYGDDHYNNLTRGGGDTGSTIISTATVVVDVVGGDVRVLQRCYML